MFEISDEERHNMRERLKAAYQRGKRDEKKRKAERAKELKAQKDMQRMRYADGKEPLRRGKTALYARNKGKRGEREVARVLQAIVDKAYIDAFKYLCKQTAPDEEEGVRHIRAVRWLADVKDRGKLRIERNAMQAARGGCDLLGCPGFAPEVKFCEQSRLPLWSAQTVEQAKLDEVPMLWYRRGKEPWRMRIFMRGSKDVTKYADFEYKEACDWVYSFLYAGFVRNVWRLL